MADREGPSTAFDVYFDRSETAAASLLFVLPWLLIYEWGSHFGGLEAASQSQTRIVAFTLLRNLLSSAGATAQWVVPAAVVSILTWQAVIRRDRWRIGWLTPPFMLLESLIMALPLLAVAMLVARIPLANGAMTQGLLSSLGAGIYEELLFRLIAFAALSAVFVDFLGIRQKIAAAIVIFLSSMSFAAYHYWGPEGFTVPSFVFRFVAGLFFGWLFLTRGFGITVGVHMVYDAYVVFFFRQHAVGV